MKKGRHGIHHNNTQQNDSVNTDTQYNGPQQNDTEHNETQRNLSQNLKQYAKEP